MLHIFLTYLLGTKKGEFDTEHGEPKASDEKSDQSNHVSFRSLSSGEGSRGRYCHLLYGGEGFLYFAKRNETKWNLYFAKWKSVLSLACVAADSFPFSAARRSNKRTKSGRAKEHAWGEPKNWGEVGRGWVRRGRGWGGKEPPAFNPKHFTELRSPTNGEQ